MILNLELLTLDWAAQHNLWQTRMPYYIRWMYSVASFLTGFFCRKSTASCMTSDTAA